MTLNPKHDAPGSGVSTRDLEDASGDMLRSHGPAMSNNWPFQGELAN